ncbi:MATE family efflux transporter [uncultured Amaricoccus sp.]|uniref:MATE family efflux transporter n=1 Tax=uncultured Amaricoccus sp. TaxID=339341 RepID=UPI0026120D00|nr:MATE family efflux transporter [uncultured Amaricoccus sp.]
MTFADSAPVGFVPKLLRHWQALFLLAWPVVLSRAGILIMTLVGVMMVGQHDTFELAKLSLGSAVFFPLLVTGVGCMVGVISSASREMGSRDPDLPAIALRGLRWSVVVGGVATLLVFGSETLLFAIGHEPALASGAGSVARMLAPGALFQIVFVAGSFYLEGTARTKPGLVVMIAANVVNFLLCRLLIGGGFGLPAMGAEGAALAGTIARFLMAAGLLVWLLRLPEFDPWRGRFFGFWGPGGRIAGAEMRRIGFAGGAAYFFETVAFASLSQAAGLLGTGALTAYSILHNVESTVFMVALGLSVATSVQVGRAAGRGDAAEAIFSGLAGLAATVVVIGAIGLGLLAIAPSVVGFYSSDPALITRAAPLIAILAVTMVFDAGQVVLGQANRAMGDSWGTTLAFFLAFFCVMIPVSLILAFRTPLAEAGLFFGTGIGCATAVVLLGYRFRLLVSRLG